jgi:hypothetical protein
MAKFPFNLQGYEFQGALDVLRKSSQAGLAALKHETIVLEQQLTDYLRVGEFEGERDEEGHVLWEQDQILNIKITDAYDAQMELRKAFAITAYHHWERSVQRWIAHKTGTANGSKMAYKELSKAATDIGYSPDSGLCRVVKLANTLKHNSEDGGDDLYQLWTDVFRPEFQKPPRFSDWASAIQLTDQHLNEIFDIVSRSGPSGKISGY